MACEDGGVVGLPRPDVDAGGPVDIADVVTATGTDAGPGSEPDTGFVRPDAGTLIMDTGAALRECDPALSVTPLEATALPLGLVTFSASGGTGDYRFEVTTDESGAILNDRSGAYLAGTVSGVTDVVTVTDVGCIGEVQARVEIVENMQVRPSRVELAPGTQMTVEVTGGAARTFHVAVDGRAGLVDAVDHPDVTLTADTETFIMLACGRVDPQERIDTGRVSWTGDAVWGEKAARSLRFTM